MARGPLTILGLSKQNTVLVYRNFGSGRALRARLLRDTARELSRITQLFQSFSPIA